MAFPVGEYINDELKARGWSFEYAASLMYGDRSVNTLYLEMLCCVELWESRLIKFSPDEAVAIGAMLDVKPETLMTIHKTWCQSVAYQRN